MSLSVFLKKLAIASLMVSVPGMVSVVGCEAANRRGMAISLDSSKEGRCIGPPQRQLLADRIEQRDSVIYQTDPEMERSAEEQEMEEKQKEERAWRMLENIYLQQEPAKRTRPPHRPPNNPER